MSLMEDGFSTKTGTKIKNKHIAQALNLVRPFPKRPDFKDEDQYLDKSELERISPNKNCRSQMSTKNDPSKLKMPLNTNDS
jgi:hypothetical protein